MRHVITPRAGQFLSAWGGFFLVALLFRVVTSQAAITAVQLVLALVVGLVLAVALDYFTRRPAPAPSKRKRRRR